MILFSLLFSALNALRGSGFWKKDDNEQRPRTVSERLLARDTWLLLMAMVICGKLIHAGYVSLPHAMILVPFFFLITLACFSPGWGKYFNVITGNLIYRDEGEVKAIDRLTTIICGYPKDRPHFIRWCFVAMSLRGLLFYPLFIALSLFHISALFYGLFTALMGVVYWSAKFVPEQYNIRYAELVYGGLLGFLIALSVG